MNKYCVVDLEMCMVSKSVRRKSYRYRNEIIQIGAVKMDETWELTDSFNEYVQPEFGAVDSYITNLTGIESSMLKDKPFVEEVLRKFLFWLGDEDLVMVSWSNADRTQLIHEIQCKHIELPQLEQWLDKERWLDYQKIFDQRFEFLRNVGLSEALDLAELGQEGRLHNGYDDALNTALLMQKLERHPEFQLSEEIRRMRSGEVENLNFSMGELFSSDLFAMLPKE